MSTQMSRAGERGFESRMQKECFFFSSFFLFRFYRFHLLKGSVEPLIPARLGIGCLGNLSGVGEVELA